MDYLRFNRLALNVSLFVLFAAIATSTIAAEKPAPRKLLFFTRSTGFEHSVVKVKDGKPCYAETILRPICEKHNWELTVTKDGDIFTPENIAKFDAFLFYTTDDLTAEKATDGSKPMSKEGKAALLEAIKNGKGYVGFHCASDTFHSEGERGATQPVSERDPYINMVGGEFIVHGSQQKTQQTVIDSKFPGAESLGPHFEKLEEWYSLKNFADDIHVILVTETKGMKDKCYDRPPYPSTWIRKDGKGHVFYTSMGHREDMWASPQFQSLIIGGITWALGDVEADTTPNIQAAAPEANTLPPK